MPSCFAPVAGAYRPQLMCWFPRHPPDESESSAVPLWKVRVVPANRIPKLIARLRAWLFFASSRATRPSPLGSSHLQERPPATESCLGCAVGARSGQHRMRPAPSAASEPPRTSQQRGSGPASSAPQRPRDRAATYESRSHGGCQQTRRFLATEADDRQIPVGSMPGSLVFVQNTVGATAGKTGCPWSGANHSERAFSCCPSRSSRHRA